MLQDKNNASCSSITPEFRFAWCEYVNVNLLGSLAHYFRFDGCLCMFNEGLVPDETHIDLFDLRAIRTTTKDGTRGKSLNKVAYWKSEYCEARTPIYKPMDNIIGKTKMNELVLFLCFFKVAMKCMSLKSCMHCPKHHPCQATKCLLFFQLT
jgi:hypothetical protein